MLYPTRGVSELGRIDPDAVMQRYGLTPAQYPDFAALRGDPSDNLPSIPGVGEKTAAKWVREFGSLAELTDRVDEVKGRGRRRVAREPRPRPAEPPAHRADPGRPAGRRARGSRGPAVGPRGRAPAVRRPRVPRAARAPLRHAHQRGAGGGRGLRGRGRRARPRHGAGVAGRPRAGRAPRRPRGPRTAGDVGRSRHRGHRPRRGGALARGEGRRRRGWRRAGRVRGRPHAAA